MSQLNLPRYFVARSDQQPIQVKPENFIPLYALDNFFAGGKHLQEQEWLVTTDASGILHAIAGDQINFLSEDIKSQLALSEVACGGNNRLVEAIEFYLFNVQLMEQAPNAPGLNDPIYLYGTLHGPYPNSQAPYFIEGQLTVSRADLLSGLLQGFPYRFTAPGMGAEPGSSDSVYHMTLPGDRDEETIRGAGIIFAYPLMPPDMMSYGAGNEILIKQYLFDIISAIKEDLESENIKLPLRRMKLPIPSRLSMEQELEAQGYLIKGDTAVRKPNASGGFQGLLHSVFGSGKADKLELPQEGKTAQFMQLAEQVLHSLPGWPPERTRIMRDKSKPATREVRMRAKGTAALSPREIKTPQLSDKPIQNQRPQQARAQSQNKPAGWMLDFIDKHQGTSNQSNKDGWVRLTGAAVPPQESKKPSGSTFSYSSNTSYSPYNAKTQTPGWMEDFSAADTDKKQERSEEKPQIKETQQQSSAKPDWMKDFE
jgi:hypothetical protein